MWTIADTLVTTTIITPESVSSRSDQATSTPPAAIQVARWITCASCWPRIWRNRRRPSTAEINSAPQVTICAPRSPIALPKKPAIAAASSGRNTMIAATASALHHVDVFDLDRAAVAEIDDQDRQSDRRLGGRDGQHEHCEDLP